MSTYGRNPKGYFSRPILESEIKAAQSISRSAKETARNLGVSYNTYKKWAKRYGIFETVKNKPGLKIPKPHRDPTRGAYPLDDIIAGKHPNYPTFKFKDKLFKSGYKKEECENCGWTEKRITDKKGPFLVDYIDGNPYNKSLENIRILCLNCTHNLRGYISRGKADLHHNLDLDKIQREKAKLKIQRVEVEEKSENEIDISSLTDEEIKQLMGE